MAKCLKCGAELNEGARFCRECGAKVPAETVTAEAAETVKSDIETTALSLRELTDKMIATYVSGMKDYEASVEKIRTEVAEKTAELEAKLSEKETLLEAKTKELAEITEKFSKLQVINQQLQTEKFDAQTAANDLRTKLAAVEKAKESLMAALTAQQAANAVPLQPAAETVAEAVQAPAAAVADAAAAASEAVTETAEKAAEPVSTVISFD